MGLNISKENALIDWLYQQAHFDLNPSDEECPDCGGDGYIYDCIDGCCVDAESGCEDCARRCIECARFTRSIERHVQVQVLRSMDLPLAVAWLKQRGKWSDKFTDQSVMANLHAGRTAYKEFSEQERADSACWVEGLI